MQDMSYPDYLFQNLLISMISIYNLIWTFLILINFVAHLVVAMMKLMDLYQVIVPYIVIIILLLIFYLYGGPYGNVKVETKRKILQTDMQMQIY